jgi:ABC-type nitrate/sulfonate/bicarbonate transport system substrate-binding protein
MGPIYSKKEKEMKKLMVMAVFGLAAILAFTGCSQKAAQAAANAGDRDPARYTEDGLFILKLPFSTVFNEFVVADERGYFKEEGIKAEFVGMVEGLSVYQLLAQGVLDVADGHPNSVAQSRLAGVKVKAVIPGMVDSPQYPHVRYIAREDGPVKSLNDIVGKKVGITGFGSCVDGYLKYYLDERGIEGEVEWVVLPTGGQPEQALTQGRIDLTTSHPPFGHIAILAGGNKQIASSWDILHSPGAGLSIRAFTEEFIEKYPEVTRGFAKAMYRARVWINANMAEAVYLVSDILGVDTASVDVEWDGFWYEETPIIQPEYIQIWFDLCEKLGYWNHGDINPEDIYTNEFAPDPSAAAKL